jgi:hypothetical protein
MYKPWNPNERPKRNYTFPIMIVSAIAACSLMIWVVLRNANADYQRAIAADAKSEAELRDYVNIRYSGVVGYYRYTVLEDKNGQQYLQASDGPPVKINEKSR